ncbi:hypothetical protein VSVS12_00614 [Vibrio scophthalmi]|nr:hypothetical protein VSVS12_00614 [Vibrio scophthalmi]
MTLALSINQCQNPSDRFSILETKRYSVPPTVIESSFKVG